MVVEDLIVRQVPFWFLVGGDNPCINLVRMSQKAGAWDQEQPSTYRVGTNIDASHLDEHPWIT